MTTQYVTDLALQLSDLLSRHQLTLSTAESCTGGGIGDVLTAIAGSSLWFLGGIISYSEQAKQTLLGVPKSVLSEHGVVSEAVVCQMAEGACAALCSDVSIAVTGIAGPSGGSTDNPVGTVWIGWCIHGSTTAHRFQFAGDRAQVRQQAIECGLNGLLQQLITYKLK